LQQRIGPPAFTEASAAADTAIAGAASAATKRATAILLARGFTISPCPRGVIKFDNVLSRIDHPGAVKAT
jgi:hypothetical protein